MPSMMVVCLQSSIVDIYPLLSVMGWFSFHSP
ncbi:MAG: hypothetical protein ACI8VR_000763, partial [Candidatus Azotimanducaceae bacterium]